ncbi:MAG: hypothetical protein IPN29_08640 [Saprospiraceae bacterium]|nr:hypothetical protein [Saprospiraceae bacterium]
MKRTLFALAVITLSFAASAQKSVKPGFIAISPVHFFRNTFVASFETGIGKDKTLVFMPGVVLKDSENEDLKGFVGEIHFRYYLLHPSFEGMDTKHGGARLQPYVGPYYQYTNLTKTYPGYKYDPVTGNSTKKEFERNTTAHAGGVSVGCRALLTRNLFLDLNVGGGFRFANVDDTIFDEPQGEYPYYEDYNIFDYEYTGIAPKVGFTIGIRIY